MNFKNGKMLAVLGVIFAATLMMSSTSQAAGKAPGEGFYAGAFLGHGTGVVQADVTLLDTSQNFESDRGGVALDGIQGGAWIGWGMKTSDDLYFGAEISGAGSDEKIELTTNQNLGADNNGTITSGSAKRNWAAGGSLRVGYYVNSETLFALSGGVAVSQFDVNIGDANESYYAGGPQVGASITTQLSKIDPNLGLRMEFVYTDYLTADINGVNGAGTGNGHNNDSTITGHDTAGRIGVTYRF